MELFHTEVPNQQENLIMSSRCYLQLIMKSIKITEDWKPYGLWGEKMPFQAFSTRSLTNIHSLHRHDRV